MQVRRDDDAASAVTSIQVYSCSQSLYGLFLPTSKIHGFNQSSKQFDLDIW